VVDSTPEIVRLATQSLAPPRQRVLIRVTPGVDAHAHPAVATGVEDQKFGFSLSSGAAADAVHRVLAHPELKLAGLHCHLGSQLTDVLAYEVARLPVPRLTLEPGRAIVNRAMVTLYRVLAVAVRDGAARLLVRRETSRDLLSRDVGL